MQTFLTDTNHTLTAKSLDQKRLVKQLLEGRQIVETLVKPEYYIHESGKRRVTPWAHHPAIMMWRGSLGALGEYLDAIVAEMKVRNYAYENNSRVINSILATADLGTTPWWMQSKSVFDNIIATHRASLYRKDEHYYRQWSFEHGNVCCARCNYYWPTHKAYQNVA